MDMYTKTLAMIDASDQSLLTIAAATGVKPRWLYRLVAGDYNDPGVKKIEALYHYLKARKLQAA